MTLGSNGWEQNSTRLGLAFLLLGVLLMLWAWGSWSYRTGASGGGLGAAPAVQAQPKVDRAKAVKSLPALLAAGVLAVLLFLGASLVIRRWSKAMREAANRRQSDPTPAEDVWASHRTPPPLDEDADEV